MTIQLVRVGDRLIGKSLSDRWNLMQLGVSSVAHDRNHGGAKRLRRLASKLGLAVNVVRDAKPVWKATPAEVEAFSGTVPAFLSQAA